VINRILLDHGPIAHRPLGPDTQEQLMTTKFKDFVREVEAEARVEGPHAVAELAAFRSHYTMAQEVRALRKERKLTQKQLAEASGIAQSEISRIERGQTNPTTGTLGVLLAPLGARLGVVRVAE
jgi:DNA-binding XRE family transcriptional regulator